MGKIYSTLSQNDKAGMKNNVENIQADLPEGQFSPEGQKEKAVEAIRHIELSKLISFKNHPFKVIEDGALQEMAESIKREGVTSPGIVRPLPDGNYELVAGHRRKRASELAGKDTMPVVIRELDDVEATLTMVDDNLFYRENLLPSEKAWAYRMKLEAIRRRAGRISKRNSGQVGQNLKGQVSVDIVAKEAGESRKQVQRYIRLTELIPELLDKVDNKELPFNAAVELSYLREEEQKTVSGYMYIMDVVPSLKQAKLLRRKAQEKGLTGAVLEGILMDEGHPAPVRIIIKQKKLEQYFPKGYTQKEMEKVIFSLLEKWKAEKENTD